MEYLAMQLEWVAEFVGRLEPKLGLLRRVALRPDMLRALLLPREPLLLGERRPLQPRPQAHQL